MATIIEIFTGSQPAGLPRTWTPQRDALLLVSLADAVVAVAVHVVAGVAVVQVDVGGAVGAGAGAELGQITGVTGFAAWSSRWLQLHSNVDSKRQSLRQRLVVKLRQICGELKRALEKYLPNFINGADFRFKLIRENIFLSRRNVSRMTNQSTSYLTVLAALSVCTNSIPLQGAGSSIAAGIHTFLQVEKKGKKKASRMEKQNGSEGEQKQRRINSAQRDHISPWSKCSDFVIRGDAGCPSRTVFHCNYKKKPGRRKETAVSSSLKTTMFPSDRTYKLIQTPGTLSWMAKGTEKWGEKKIRTHC